MGRGLLLLLLSILLSPAWAQKVPLYYPSKDNADFSVLVPGEWELEQAEEAGGFFSVTGPTGMRLSFRTVAATEEDVDAATSDSMEWLTEAYDNVETQLTDEVSGNLNGLQGHGAVFSANDKEDGRAVVIVWQMLVLEESQLAELFAEVDADDEEGVKQAREVISSLRAH